MLPVHFERENEGASWHETYREQTASESHLLLLSVERQGRHELCFSRASSPTESEMKPSSSSLLMIKQDVHLNGSRFGQNTILIDGEMYLVATGETMRTDKRCIITPVPLLIRLSVMDLEPSHL